MFSYVQIHRVQRPQDQFIYQFEGVESESKVKNVDFRGRNGENLEKLVFILTSSKMRINSQTLVLLDVNRWP